MAPKKPSKKAPKKGKKTPKQTRLPSEGKATGTDVLPYPTDVEAFKGGPDGFAGKATFRLAHFGRSLKLRDTSNTFRARFAKAEVLDQLAKEFTQAIAKANLIRRNIVGRSYQIGCVIRVKYHGSPRREILTGFTGNMPLTRAVTQDDLLRAYGHALSQTLASPEEIEVLSFNMLVWFRATSPQILCLKAVNGKTVPTLYDADGIPDPSLRAFQREKRKANTVKIRTRFGI